LFYVLFVPIVLFYILFVCKCVLCYCHRLSTQLQFKKKDILIITLRYNKTKLSFRQQFNFPSMC